MDRLHNYWYSRWSSSARSRHLPRRLRRRREAVRAAARRARPRAGRPRFVQRGAVPRVAEPLLPLPKDTVFRAAAWLGVALSCSRSRLAAAARRAGSGRGVGAAVGAVSLVRQRRPDVLRFGWETLLCEVGFFTIFAGAGRPTPNIWLDWIWRWTLFRLMFGAGLIKLRGDPCWRDLTCLNYYFETQPMPNPLSWYFHWMPAQRSTRRRGVQPHRRA